MTKDVYLGGGVRTAVGSFGGAFESVPAVALGSATVRAALERTGLPPDQVEEVLFGNVLSAGLGQNVARQVAIGAGLSPTIGATMEGQLDYGRDDVRVRGTFIPAYGLNNMFGRLPLVGPLLGGQNEGLLGVTYEVVGPPHAPTLHVNPISAVAPGFLRKLFEFRAAPAETAGPQDFQTR